MKIAVTSTGPTLNDQVEARFGRCPYFLIVDTDSLEFEAVENPNLALGGGAGIQSAQMMAEKGVSHVLTGNCGPNAFRVFGEAGIHVVVGVAGPVREAVERFKAGEFTTAGAPNVQSHFGMGTGQEPGQVPNSDVAHAPTGTPRMGMGRGMGGGCRGMGRGRGMRGGMGLGPGHPSHGGFMGFGAMYGAAESPHINQGLHEIGGGPSRLGHQRAQVAAGGGTSKIIRRAVAFVRPDRCAGCGICLDICRVGAIRMEERAIVDPALCTACAACVAQCPNEAVIIIQQKMDQ